MSDSQGKDRKELQTKEMVDAVFCVLCKSICWLRRWVGVREKDIREGSDLKRNHLLNNREVAFLEGQCVLVL